jgi:zinc transporter
MSDQDSLIVAYLLDRKGSGKKIGWEEINAWEPEQGLLWVHMDFTADYTAEWLNEHSGLDKITSKALVLEESRPRSVISPNGLLMFLRGVNLNPGHDPEDMVSIRIWVDQHRIITTRKRHLLSVDDIRLAISEGIGPKTPADFLIKLNDCLINRMSDVVGDIDDQSDELEEEVLTTESHLLRPKIADIRRESIMIRRYLAPQREALNRMYLEETPLLNQTDRIRLREATDRIIRCIEDLDSARERASITQEELTSRLSEQMDKRMYILSLVAVIFLPLSFVTGLLGINVGGIPGVNYKWAFLIVCTILSGFALLLIWLFYKKKWI